MARCKGGITLVEVLVVTAIVAVLAAIVLAVFGNARTRAKEAGCLANLRTIGKAMLLYAQDHEDSPPPYWTLFDPKGDGAPHRAWRDALKRYGAVDSSFLCPLDPGGEPIIRSSGVTVFRHVTTYEHSSALIAHRLVSQATPHMRISSVPHPSHFGYACDAAIRYEDTGGPMLRCVTFHGNYSNCVFFDGSVGKDKPIPQ